VTADARRGRYLIYTGVGAPDGEVGQIGPVLAEGVRGLGGGDVPLLVGAELIVDHHDVGVSAVGRRRRLFRSRRERQCGGIQEPR